MAADEAAATPGTPMTIDEMSAVLGNAMQEFDKLRTEVRRLSAGAELALATLIDETQSIERRVAQASSFLRVVLLT